MIISSQSPEENGKAGALAPVPDLPAIDSFAGTAHDTPTTPRGIRGRLLDYSAHAAMIVGLIGFAWTVGDHVISRPALPDAPAKAAAARPAAVDPLDELRSRNRALADTVQSLQARLDTLQAGLGSARTEQTAAVARLDGKIDKIAHEPGSRIQQLVDRLGKLERSSVDVAPTASLPRQGEAEAKSAEARPAVPTAHPLPRPAELKVDAKEAKDVKGPDSRPAGDEAARPPVLASWVVRGVYGGVALIEGRRGTLEVVPGVSIPGAGVVKSIDRHGNGWTVTTTKGLVAYAAPARDYRRADRGSYGYGAPGYGYDF